jgi:hypothetical protein
LDHGDPVDGLVLAFSGLRHASRIFDPSTQPLGTPSLVKTKRRPGIIRILPSLLAIFAPPILAAEEGAAAIDHLVLERQRVVERLRDHIGFLAADELEGRDSGEPGLEVAAAYIARRFAEYGLVPAGDSGTWFHHFSLSSGSAFVDFPGVRWSLGAAPWVDWHADGDVEAFAFGSSESGEPLVADAPVVFVGYGISAETHDDYAGIDVKGSIVIVLRFTPRMDDPDDPLGGRRGPHAPLVAKLVNAKKHGAVGVIFTTPPGADEGGLEALRSRASPEAPLIPAVLARRTAVERLFELGGKSLEETTRAIRENRSPASASLVGVRARFSTARRRIGLRNVVGRVRGTDDALADQSIVVGGHYDHIGRHGDQVAESNIGEIHNGADDNASGTAAVLELARCLAAKPAKRSVVFIAFSGEEVGLHGSRAWVDAPRYYRSKVDLRPDPGAEFRYSKGALFRSRSGSGRRNRVDSVKLDVLGPDGKSIAIDPDSLEWIGGPDPVERIIAMINLDMVGRSGSSPAVAALAAITSPEFPPLLERLGAELEIDVSIPPDLAESGGSDHENFLAHEIPVAFFHTGITRTYNTPSDDLDTLNLDAEALICDLAERFLREIGDRTERPTYEAPGRRDSIARPRLGVQVESSDEPVGARITRVLPGSPAETAGLLPGDVIVALATRPVAGAVVLPSLLRRAIQDREDGVVVVGISRGGVQMDVEAKLPRPGN